MVMPAMIGGLGIGLCFINFRGEPNIIPASLLYRCLGFLVWAHHMFTVGLDTLLYMILIIPWAKLETNPRDNYFSLSFDLDLICYERAGATLLNATSGNKFGRE
ncbi:hypothetical protein ACJX0J_002931 (mitochondrion) [Zea mays]